MNQTMNTGLSGKTKLIFLGLLLCVSNALAGSPRVTGTYSSLEYNPAAGDLNGMEVRVVLTNEGYKATVQFSEGGAGDIFIVPFKTSNGHISFDVRSEEGKPAHFSGNLTDKGLKGTIKYPSGASEIIFLPRKKSYWD
jgi:hypothetical protein